MKSSPPANAADHRHDDVVDQRANDLAEGRADDHADREVHDISTHRELLEFLERHDPPMNVVVSKRTATTARASDAHVDALA